MKKRLSIIVLAALASILAMPIMMAAPTNASPGEVLILDSTVTGGAGSTLAQKFVLAGKTPVVVSPAQWSTMTAADFDAYDAIVLGDPTCVDGTGPVAAAQANAAVWSSVVDGNVVVIGTDETFHESQGGALLMEKAAAFSVAGAGKTGAYISLSCYYHDTAPGTPVPLLSGFGSFTATGVGCYNNAHIVATHPALNGLTDSTLSNWTCSVHEAFDSWPVSFEVLAIARDIGTSYTAPDGSVGTPYILARGVEVISDIDLTPATSTNDIGTSHTVTATVTKDDPSPGTPVVGTTVTFTVVAGPHTGTTGNGVTNSSGVATFSYTGTAPGTDIIEATFVDALGRTQRSNRVEKTWVVKVQISINDVIVNEGDAGLTPATFTVSLSSPAPAVGVTVKASTANGTATTPADYVAQSGTTLSFAAGETSRPFIVQVAGDLVDEPTETFLVDLSAPTNATIADGQGVGTIVDDDRNGRFSCRASGLRLGTVSELAVANPVNDPCADDAKSVLTATATAGPGATIHVTSRTLNAATDQTPNDLEATAPATTDNGLAVASVEQAKATGFGVTITATAVLSDAKVECVSAPGGGLMPKLKSSSSVANLTINGNPVDVKGSLTITLPGGLGSVAVNRTIETSTSVTQQAVRVELAGITIVIAEAKANFTGNPCAV